MPPNFLESLATVVTAVAFASMALTISQGRNRRRVAERLQRRIADAQGEPGGKFRNATRALSDAATQFEAAIKELSDVAAAREEAATRLQARVTELIAEEERQRVRVETLQQVPLPAIEAFEAILDSSEKKSNRREIRYFIAGAFTTFAIEAVLRWVFP